MNGQNTRDFGNLRFWKNARVPCFKNPQTILFLKSIKLFHIYGKMRLEKLIMKNPISDFFTETFDLLSAGQSENLVFRPQPQGGQICVSWAHPLGPGLGPPTWAQLGPQTPPPPPAAAPPAPPDEFSN